MTRHFRTFAALCCLSILFAGIAQRIASGQQERERKPVKWVNPEVPADSGLQHKILSSKSLGHDVGYVVWTPPELDPSGKTRYPVIYFLHGIGGTEISNAQDFSLMVATGIRQGVVPPAICVFPNGGRSGYRGEVESMIVDELIPLIDESYPTKKGPASRVVAGFSMGGAGSARLSLLHPDLFCAAGSWGGGLSRRGSGADSPLLEAAKSNAATLKKHHFSMLLINGDKDHPEGYTLLAETLEPLDIPHKIVILKDTHHNLGLYHQKSSKAMIEFLGQQLKLGQSASK